MTRRTESKDAACGAGASPRDITVGPRGADVQGTTGRAIQLAVDAVALRGGGTVRVMPGEYVLTDAVRLRSDIALVGDRDRTVLRRGPLVWSPLKVDADVGQTQITPADPSGFCPGMGVCLRDDRVGWACVSTPHLVTDVRDGVLHLADFMTTDRLAESGGRVVNYFPLILAENADRCTVDGFTIDAAVDDPDGAIGDLRAAGIYFHHSTDGRIRNVLARHVHGDGMCFGKASVRMTVEDCEARDNWYYGIHPGSHSAHSAVRRCHIHGNGSDGLYVCWGIHHSTFEDNHVHHNGWLHLRSGISIGHKDTDNLLQRNHVHENAKFGICVRRKTAANGAHRCVYRENVIENNGSRPDQLADIKAQLPPWESVGCGVSICGVTRDLVFEDNRLRETRSGDERTQQHALCLRDGVSHVTMRGNQMSGHPGAAVLDESGAADHVLQTE